MNGRNGGERDDVDPVGAGRHVALEALWRVDEEGLLAREALDVALSRRREPIDARDADLAAEIVQGVLRTEIQLDHVLGPKMARPASGQDPDVMRVLRIGLYQILHLDRIPRWAAVSSAVELVVAAGKPLARSFVNAVLRRLSDGTPAPRRDEPADPERALPRGDGLWIELWDPCFPPVGADPSANLGARFGVPRWAVARFLAQHGAAGARQILAASLARPSLSIRPRAGRGEALSASLAAAGWPNEREGPCLLLRGAGHVPAIPGFTTADFAVQDPTAAEAALAVAAQPGERVLDVCAAPGGKTFALAEAVGADAVDGGGRVVAVDVPGPRAARLRAEVARRAAANVSVHEADAQDAAALPPGPFDAVLVDAPCSNTGVLSRRVEARRRLHDDEALRSLVPLQRAILAAAATRVAPGGRLVWSTCSLDDEENGAQVRAFLAAASAAGASWRIDSERTTLPVASRRDGGYAAVLRRG